MRKLMMLSLMFVLLFIVKSKAQTIVSSYSDFPGGVVYADCNIGHNAGLEVDDIIDYQPTGYYPIYYDLIVWVTGDLNDEVDLVHGSGANAWNASGSWDPTSLAFLYPGENFTIHYFFEIDYWDGGSNYPICSMQVDWPL